MTGGREAGFRFQRVSGGFRGFQVSGFKFQVSGGFRGFQVSSFKFQVLGGFKFQGRGESNAGVRALLV